MQPQITLWHAWEDYKRCRPLKRSSQADYQKRLEHCLPDWLDVPLSQLTKDQITDRHRQLTIAGAAQANVTMRVLRAVYNFALIRYDSLQGTTNPVKTLSELRSWNRVKRRKTTVYGSYLKAWWQAVHQLTRPEARDYFLLLLFTGLRRMEAASLQVKDIDLANGLLRVKDTKNGEEHVLPLSDYLIKLLIKRVSDKSSGDYIFEGRDHGTHLLYPNRQLQQVRDKINRPWILHDLRRTFLTVADELEIPIHIIKRLANHKQMDVTEHYIVPSIERLRRPMQQITNRLLEIAEANDILKV